VRFVARHDGRDIPVEVELHSGAYRVKVGERWVEADLANAGPFLRSLRLADGRQFALVHHQDGNRHEVTLTTSSFHVEITDPLALRRRKSDDATGAGGILRAPMPGRIVRVLVETGAAVRKGAGLMILEAMKMENEVQAPTDGIVDRIFVEAGQTVESGADLAHIEAD
jgi:3-methylcrotonyl-CoA carboxylase alpha subunit